MASRAINTSVLIVGGGPVGLTLAMDLASRSIDVVVAELRHVGEPPSVKCNHVSARSMEIYRRLGLAQKLRDAGLPADFPNDSVYRVTTIGPELSRIHIPCRRDRYTAKDGPDTWWPTAEPPHRINQLYAEPVLFEHARQMARLLILNRTVVEGYTEDTVGIVAEARDLDSGDTLTVAAEFIVGCDGARSMVRKAIGANLAGTSVI